MPQPIKILMLHGFTQSGPLFHAKTKALEKHLQKLLSPLGGVQLIYPTGPLELRLEDLPNWEPPSTSTTTPTPPNAPDQPPHRSGLSTPPTLSGTVTPSPSDNPSDNTTYHAWWRRNDPLPTYTGLPSPCLTHLYPLLATHGPFDGVIGFSQGAALAAILASCLEPPRRAHPPEGSLPAGWPTPPPEQPPFAFAVCYSGFRAPVHEEYNFLYTSGEGEEGGIDTPTLHFIGSLDTVVEEERSMALVRTCRREKVVYHPGGHFLPGGKMYLGAVGGFIVDCLRERERGGGRGQEGQGQGQGEGVEDMDVPF